MADTFAYDLIAFLRVIYQRRWFIIKGAAATTVVSIFLSLVLPETWRANGGVYVSTPAYKTNLKIADQQGFDVNWYEGILSSDSLYFEIIDTYKWLHRSIHQLLDTEAIERLKDNLNEKAATLTKYQLIENTNLGILTELLLEGDDKENKLMQTRIFILGHLSHEDIEEIYNNDIQYYEDLSVHDLRQDLSTHVAVLVDTNLEKIYSKRISIAAEAGTANGAKMLANIWLELFQARAEQTVRAIFNKEVELQKQRYANSELTLNSAETALKDFDRANPLEPVRTEIASKNMMLYGGTEKRLVSVMTEEEFDITDETKPFVTQKRNQTEEVSFQSAEKYTDSLIHKKNDLEYRISVAQFNTNPEEVKALQSVLNAVNKQISVIEGNLKTLYQNLRDKETERSALVRAVEQAKDLQSVIQPLLSDALLLESRNSDVHYSDASIDKAVKPDKRVFPRRSLMTVIGGFLGLILFIGLAFFQDIWLQVIREDESVEAIPTPES